MIRRTLDRKDLLRLAAGGAAAALAAPATAGAAPGRSVGRRRALKGSVNALGWQSELPPHAIASFQKRTGIHVNTLYMTSPDDIFTKLKAGGLGQNDVNTPDGVYIKNLVDAGLLAPIDVERLKNWKDIYPTFKQLPWNNIGGQHYAVPNMWGTWPMMYNAKEIHKPPRSWEDVLKPEYKGKVVMGDDSVGSILVFGHLLGFKDPTHITQTQLDHVIDYLIHIKKTQARAVASWPEMADIMARGEAIISTGGAEEIVPRATAKGAPWIRWTHPKEGDFMWVDCFGLAQKAPHEDESYQFMDWMMRPESAVEMVKGSYYGTPHRRAVRLLPAKFTRGYLYGSLGDFQRIQKVAPLYGTIPSKPVGKITSVSDWVRAWQRFKAA